jgi:ketosteroid isomerase-like protein
MSQENVEIVRAGYDHLNQVGEANRELFDPDATIDATRLPGFGFYRDVDAFVAAWLPYRDTFDEWRIEVEQLIEGRRERVIAFVHDGGRIKGSTREILQPVFHVYEFRAGKVVSLQIFLDRAEALEAVGLSEEQDAHVDS